MASQSEIEKLLADVRTAIERNKCTLWPRQKNKDTLSRLGLTLDDAYAEIYDLSVADYHDGPSKDRDNPTREPIWIFKKTIFRRVVYIKFKVMYLGDGSVTVISFHIDNVE